MSTAIFSRAAFTTAALTLAYVASAVVGLNRLAWLGTHQGRFYRSYWVFVFGVAFFLFLMLWKTVTASVWRSSLAGVAVGYAASFVATQAKYFQLGLTGPLDVAWHDLTRIGIGHAISQILFVPLLTGGAAFGILASLWILVIARKRAGLATLLAVLIVAIAATAAIIAPSTARFKHIHFL